MSGVWAVDGYDLTSLGVRDVETRDGWDGVTAGAGANGTVPNRSGSVWRPKVAGPGSLGLSMWMSGTTEAAVWSAWNDLLKVVTPLHRLVRITRATPSGEVRECYGELSGTINPTWVTRTAMRAGLTFSVPSGFWKSTATVTSSTAAGSALTQVLTLPGLAQSTGPIEDAVLTIDGPVTNPVIAETSNGGGVDQVLYTGAVPTGMSLILDCGTWGITAAGGWTVNPGAVMPTGRRLLTLAPAVLGSSPVLQLSGSGGGAGTRLTIAARNTYRM